MTKQRKGITPVIAIIVLLFITIALAGAAWSFLYSYFFQQTSKSFTIPANGAFCEDGRVKVFITNTAFEGSLTSGDFVVAEVDGTSVPLINLPLAKGDAAKVIDYDCGGACSTGFHSVSLGTASDIKRTQVACP